MAWDPDSGTALTADAIRIADVEGTSMKLWAEFLGGWFDGGSHLLRGVTTLTPALQTGGLMFQETPQPKQDGLCIQVVTDRQNRCVKRLWSDEIWHLTETVRLDFYFRALVKTPRADGHNTLSLVRWASDTLFCILESNLLTIPLQRKGMGQFRPQPPVLVTGGNAMRRLTCGVTYTYSNEETTMVTAPVVQSDAPAGTVYLGADRETRVTPDGLEMLGPDGNWYRVNVRLLQGDNGLVPTTDVQLVA